MGTLFYGSNLVPISLPDVTLAHVQAVACAKLRRDESFTMTWRHAPNETPGKTTIWLEPGIPLRFVLDTGPPRLDPIILRRYLDAASTTSRRGARRPPGFERRRLSWGR